MSRGGWTAAGRATGSEQQQRAERRDTPPPPSILIVDDNPKNLLAFEALLASLGARIVAASEPRDALARLDVEEFAVALIDVQMPGMDGIELARRLRGRGPDAPTPPPIIFVTALDRDHRHTAAGYAAGAVDFLYKPVDPDVLRAKVATFVELHRRRGASALAERLQAQAGQLERQHGEAQAMAEELEQTNEELQRAAAEADEARGEAEAIGRRLLATLESIRDGFFTLDREHRVTFANGGTLHLWRRTREEVLGRNMWELFPEALSLAFYRETARALAEGVITEYEEYFPPLAVWLSVRTYPTPEGVAVHLRDITRRRAAEDALRRGEERYRTLIEVTAQVVWAADAEGLVDDMPAWRALTGQTPDEARGLGWLDAIHPEDRASTADLWRAAVAARRPIATAYRIRMADGSYRWFGVRGAPVLRPDGTVREWVGSCSDIDERMRAEDARGFLAQASDALSATLSFHATLGTVAELAVSRLADGCALHLLRADGSFERAAVASRDPARAELLARIDDRSPLPPDASASYPHVVRTGRSELAGPEAFAPAALGTLTPDAEVLAMLARLEMYSAMVVPIPVRGHPIGALTLVLHGPGRRRPFDAADLSVAEELGRRAGLALENTQLYEAEQEARRLAERAAERTARLQVLTAALAEAVTPDEAARAVVEQGIAALGAAAGLVALLTPDGAALEVVHATGYRVDVVARAPRVSRDARVPIADAVRAGEPVVVASPAELAARYPDLAAAPAQFAASASVPLVAEGRVLGVMGLGFAGDLAALGVDDRTFLRALGQQGGQALRRATLYAAEAAARREAEAAERRLAFLAEAGAVLGGSVDYEATVRAAARLAVPFLADYCMVDLLDDDGQQLRRLAESHADPAKEPLLRGTERYYPRAADERHPLRASLESRQARLVDEVDDAWADSVARTPEHRADLRALAPRSFITVPLLARDRPLGVITFVTSDSGRRYGPPDLALAEELARRVAAAVDRARLFRAVEATRRLAEAASRAKTDFLATMSHELRTPLNAIAGYVQLLEMGLRGPMAAEQLTDLARIKRNQEHLLALINDVLDVAKLEAGRVELRPDDVSLAEVLDGVQALVAPQVQAKGLAYDYRRPDTAVAARADRERLQQIVVNLLSNAVKFTPAGGRVTLDAERRGGGVVVRVADTGRGIPASKLEAIFEPFVQVESVHTRTQGGTGLGLAISRDLARRMEGDLTVESEVGAGSTFTLRLPGAG
ncbi:MAG TPA: GAF domain-containing protein [Gemmatimonadaceae bacterium]|nr:GAF domain-containing protein [Gemmatimonadaceae bacterium]